MSDFTLDALGLDEETRSGLPGEMVERLAATLDRASPTSRLPITWHWIFFVPVAATSRLGPDGHPRRPAGRLSDGYPRRMFAGGRLRSEGGLVTDVPAIRRSHITRAEEKTGRSGRLLLVTVSHVYEQENDPVLEEEQDLVYLPATPAITPPLPRATGLPERSWAGTRTPDRALLFRYSALTFNAHRIHYDHAWATVDEGHPDLVVQGPLTATLLADLAADEIDRPLSTFRFRAVAPLFVDQPIHFSVSRNDSGTDLEAVRVDGTTAMSASAS